MKSLKEWAAVVSALEGGEQTVLLRKGGIMETASGFRVESDRFLLFPTTEHQGRANIKERFHGLIGKEGPPMEGHNRISSYAEVLAEADVTSGERIDMLSKFHIWSKSCIDGRMGWKEERPMKAMFLKVFRIPEFHVPVRQEYQGCKSWIEIDWEIPDGEQVLGDAEIGARLAEFREITG